jgi:hypothetical protein
VPTIKSTVGISTVSASASSHDILVKGTVNYAIRSGCIHSAAETIATRAGILTSVIALGACLGSVASIGRIGSECALIQHRWTSGINPATVANTAAASIADLACIAADAICTAGSTIASGGFIANE